MLSLRRPHNRKESIPSSHGLWARAYACGKSETDKRTHTHKMVFSLTCARETTMNQTERETTKKITFGNAEAGICFERNLNSTVF